MPANKSSTQKSTKVVKADTRKATAIKDAFTKTQTISAIAEATNLTKKQVTAVLDELGHITHRHIKSRGAGQFTVPGLPIKIKVARKPAKKAHPGVNPFTGEEIMIKAKPAHNVVKVMPLKKLKEMVS